MWWFKLVLYMYDLPQVWQTYVFTGKEKYYEIELTRGRVSLHTGLMAKLPLKTATKRVVGELKAEKVNIKRALLKIHECTDFTTLLLDWFRSNRFIT